MLKYVELFTILIHCLRTEYLEYTCLNFSETEAAEVYETPVSQMASNAAPYESINRDLSANISDDHLYTRVDVKGLTHSMNMPIDPGSSYVDMSIHSPDTTEGYYQSAVEDANTHMYSVPDRKQQQ